MEDVIEGEVVEETILESEEVVVDEVAAEEVEYSEAEQDAMTQGWSPDGAEGKRTLTAEEYLDRKPLYDKLHKQGKQIKKLDEKFDAMQKHEGMVRDRMHKDHLKDLQTAQRAAMEDMDYDKAGEISDEIVEAKVEHAKVEPVVSADSQDDIQSTLEDWVDKNNWYKEDDFLQRQAEKEGKIYRMENPNASFEDVLGHISKTVKKDFPEKFQNMNRQKPTAVEGSAQGAKRTPAKPKQKTAKDLPEEAISVMNTLIQAGAFKSKQDYVNDYFEQK